MAASFDHLRIREHRPTPPMIDDQTMLTCLDAQMLGLMIRYQIIDP